MRRHFIQQSIIRGQSGIALVTVLTLAFVLMILASLILDLSLKETATTAARRTGAQSFYIAEGGAVAARAGLLAFMGADPAGCSTGCAILDTNLTAPTLLTWYASGVAGSQNPINLLNWIKVDNLEFIIPSSVTSAIFQVNWSLATNHLRLQYGTPAVSNTMGNGSYTSSLTISPWTGAGTEHFSCAPLNTNAQCPIHQLPNGAYEFFYTYSVTSDGQSSTGRRRITFAGNFSLVVQNQSFSKFSLFTDVHLTPAGGAIWFTNSTSFDGPVHTNGEFRFAFFPQFGTPDPGTPCNVANIKSSPLESVNPNAWFNNNGVPVELAANENVVSGTRIDAPVMPGCDPANISNNPSANFSRGVAAVTMPSNPYSQQGVSVGIDPSPCAPNCTQPTDAQIAAVIPELQVPPCPPTCSPALSGIYIPRSADLSGSMSGGIYVNGNLDSMSLSYSSTAPCTDTSCGIYTLVQGTQTVTMTVDRKAGTTTLTNTNWATPQTRTFTGVPKGVQASSNANAAVIYVKGNISAISGTLGQNEQTTVAASGSINITNNLIYQTPPVTTNPTSNPTNLLGLFSSGADITIATTAPNDIQIHAVMMAGSNGNPFNSSVNVTNYNVGAPRGQVHLIGGIIEKYYGAFVTFNSVTGLQATGYGRDFKYDRRMSRGFAPPFFPTTALMEFVQGSKPLAGQRPTWREATPPP
jgi:hypothetical protein